MFLDRLRRRTLKTAAGAGLRARPARVNLEERFAAIFAFKPGWTLDELDPYVEATADATVEAQLLEYARESQPNAKATATYSKRCDARG